MPQPFALNITLNLRATSKHGAFVTKESPLDMELKQTLKYWKLNHSYTNFNAL